MTLPRRRNNFVLFLFLAWGLLSLSGREILPDRRKIDPVMAPADNPAMAAVQRKIALNPARPDADVPVFFRLETDDPAFPDRVRDLGGTARWVAPGLYTGQIPRDAARYLSNRPEVAHLEAAKRARPLLDVSAPAVSADLVQAGSPGWPPPLNGGIRGNNVYVGVVDTGLDNAHLDFHTGESGSPSRVAHTYASPQLPLSEANPLTDEDGHGTHVMGIAAGNGFHSAGTYTGMAPNAIPLVGKTSFFTTDIVNAVSNLLSFAGTAPVSINLSLGLATGPHDGTSAFESAINSLATEPAGSSRLISVAAGNERTDGEHFQAVLPSFGIVTAFLTLEDTSGAAAEIYADGDDRYTVTATLGSDTVTVASGSSGLSPGGWISVSNRTFLPSNGATFISVFFLPQSTGQSGNIQLRRTRNGGSGKLDGYIDWNEGTFDTATESGSITEPANADNVIAVGSYNTKSGGEAGPIGGISSFSSLGPTRDGRMKPDVAAPGSVIYSARSRDAFFNPSEVVPANDNYVILQGTSMAAPHVAGIAALVWESNPALTGAQMRERLKRTSTPILPTPNTTWGYGKANALAAVSASVASIGAPATAVPETPVPLTSGNSSGAFGNPISYTWAFLSRPTGSGATFSSPTASSTSFTPDIPGNYRISLTVTQAFPAGTAAGITESVVHVNNLPTGGISGPSSTDNVTPVVFTGTGSDADNQALSFHWILLAKPPGSTPSFLVIPVGADNVTLVPDLPGDYEIGLRVDDGMDNSALVSKTFTASGFLSMGGGGSCSVTWREGGEDPPSAIAALSLYLFPLWILALRKRYFFVVISSLFLK
ncbi:MAG: hypothetical protein A2X88_00500 [Deltaproteobacteria bacterium GWC2_65_14]|nr:MAG: hypothetical protein A2X88_00500 [Deltaproteobacteria bacterium GWC2_65_14]